MSGSGFNSLEEEWPETVHLLTEKMKKTNFPHQVSSVKSLEEMVGKVLDNISVRNKISTWISKCSETKYVKSGSMASRLRDKGNEKFGQRDNLGALKLYSESVICAPEIGPELSLAFGNRSAALFHLGDYQSAFDDINLALVYKYPKKTEYKLLQRQAQCLIRLGHYKSGMEHLALCEISLNSSAGLTDDKSEAITKDLAAIKTEAQKLLNDVNQSPKKSPDASILDKNHLNDANTELPGASSKLSVKSSSDNIKGRFVVTNEDVEVGEVLFFEQPYSCVLLPEHYSSHCNHCLVKLLGPISCRRCTQPRYCSSSCRDTAWSSYHQYECGYLDLFHSVGIGHLAVRTVLTARRDHILDVTRSVRSGSYIPSPSDQYSLVFGLQHHLNRLPVEEVFQYVVTAALIVTVLSKHTSFLSPERVVPGVPGMLKPVQPGHEVDESIVNYVGSLVLRHISQLVGNAHAVTELVESEGEVEQVRLASGIYPSASMMNHSCIPAIINSFSGSVLQVRSVRRLSAGEEVTNCYGPHYRRHSYTKRQEMLAGQYRFRCSCPACTDPSEKTFFDQFTSEKCEACAGPVIQSQCSHCIKPSDEGSCNRRWEELYKNAQSQPDNLTKLRETEREMMKVLYCHHENLTLVRDMLARCLARCGNYVGAADYLKLTLATTKLRYGEGSIEVANELLKFSDVLIAESNNSDDKLGDKEIVDILVTAGDIFHLQYGEKSKQFVEIQEKLCYFNRE